MALHLYSIQGSFHMVYTSAKASLHCSEQKCSITLISQAHVVSVSTIAASWQCPVRRQLKSVSHTLQDRRTVSRSRSPSRSRSRSYSRSRCYPSPPPHLRPQAASAPIRPCSCAWDTPSRQRACPSSGPSSALWRAATCQLLPAKLWRLWAHGAKSSGRNVSAPACSSPHKPNAGQPAGTDHCSITSSSVTSPPTMLDWSVLT